MDVNSFIVVGEPCTRVTKKTLVTKFNERTGEPYETSEEEDVWMVGKEAFREPLVDDKFEIFIPFEGSNVGVYGIRVGDAVDLRRNIIATELGMMDLNQAVIDYNSKIGVGCHIFVMMQVSV